MFKEGEYIMYSNYGACLVDEIREKEAENKIQTFYILHPISDVRSKIMTPTDNDRVKIRSIMSSEAAEDIYTAMYHEGVTRISNKKLREQVYNRILKEGNPEELVEIIKAIILEENERVTDGKKISATDRKYLERAERLLYSEMSVALNITPAQIKEKVAGMLRVN